MASHSRDHKTANLDSKLRENQGRSVDFLFRYAQESVVKQAPKAPATRGVWGQNPPENFIFRALEMPFPNFSREKFHKSKHEKKLTIQ